MVIALSSKDKAKASLERKQFSYFLNVLQLVHVPSDIESRSKPEPDICFQNRIVFELTEICPSEVAHTNSKLLKAGGGVKIVYPTESAARQLNEKLNKSYQSALPIELLCFRTSRTLWPDDHIVHQMRQELSVHQNIQFRRIWYLGEGIEVLYNPQKLIGL